MATLFFTVIVYTTCIYTTYAQPWQGNYVKQFYKDANDTEHEAHIQMDEVIYNFTETKSGVMFSGVFTNNTVLQRAPQLASLYGTCDTPNTEIILTIKNENFHDLSHESIETYSTTSMDNGDWKITLSHTYKNGDNFTLSVHCEQCSSTPYTTTIYNITFGDIFLCLGQSNMALEIEFTFNKQNTLSNITQLNKYSNIRFYNKRHSVASDETSMFVLPREDALNNGKYQWHSSSNADAVNRFSATCWYTAQSLVDMYGMSDINFGLILLAVGGSQIEQWIQNNTIQTSDCAHTTYDCLSEGCGNLYNGMLSPFTNMSIKGILWYQGENNVKQQMSNYSNESSYACLEQLMIEQYRNLWNDSYLPVGVFELPAGTSEGFSENMPFFRHAQTGNYGMLPNEKMENVFMAQAYDIGDPWRGFGQAPNNGFYPVPYDWNTTKIYMGSVHPRAKLLLGQRMAMNLNKFVYGKNEIWSGPLLKSCELNMYDQVITIEFNENILYDEKVLIQPLSLWYNESLVNTVNNWSAIKLLINDKWIDLNGMNVFSVDNNGYIIHIDISNVLDNGIEIIKGISYAWDDNPCCGDLNQHKYPCPMNMCPIITSKSKLPAIPFQAKIVDNKCQCFHPQTCDGSDYVMPEMYNDRYDRITTAQPTPTIMPTPEPTKRPTRSPTIDTWIFNECNVVIHSQALTSTNTVVYFKYSHPRMDSVSKPMVTFIVNDLEVTTTYNEIEYIDLSKDKINSAIKNNKFEARLSFIDDFGYTIKQNRIKCSYVTQSPTVAPTTGNPTNNPSEHSTTGEPTTSPNVKTVLVNNGNSKQVNNVKQLELNVKQLELNVQFEDSFTVFTVFMLCILVNIAIIGCYYCSKKRRE